MDPVTIAMGMGVDTLRILGINAITGEVKRELKETGMEPQMKRAYILLPFLVSIVLVYLFDCPHSFGEAWPIAWQHGAMAIVFKNLDRTFIQGKYPVPARAHLPGTPWPYGALGFFYPPP